MVCIRAFSGLLGGNPEGEVEWANSNVFRSKDRREGGRVWEDNGEIGEASRTSWILLAVRTISVWVPASLGETIGLAGNLPFCQTTPESALHALLSLHGWLVALLHHYRCSSECADHSQIWHSRSVQKSSNLLSHIPLVDRLSDPKFITHQSNCCPLYSPETMLKAGDGLYIMKSIMHAASPDATIRPAFQDILPGAS